MLVLKCDIQKPMIIVLQNRIIHYKSVFNLNLFAQINKLTNYAKNTTKNHTTNNSNINMLLMLKKVYGY